MSFVEELVFSDNPDLAAADIFSLGATVYELCSGAAIAFFLVSDLSVLNIVDVFHRLVAARQS